MSDVALEFFHGLGALPWLEIIRSGATAFGALVAFLALRNWKRQDTAKRKADFLDEVISATHDFIFSMRRVSGIVQSITIGFEAHRAIERPDASLADGAIAYIESKHDTASRILAESLSDCQPAATRLQSVVSKAQIFDFLNATEFQNASRILLWQFERCHALLSIVQSPTWNWEHPEVRSLLEQVVEISADEINEQIGENDVAIVRFCRDNLARLYG